MNGYRSNGYQLRMRQERPVSTGNDIVALRATRPERTNLPRFYSRILTIAEQELYRRLDHPELTFDRFVWLCWSAKESAYKYTRRNHPGLVFSPLKIAVSQLLPPDDTAEGYYRCHVSCGQEMLYSRSFLRQEVVVTVVSNDREFKDTRWGFQSISSSACAEQSLSARTFALRELSAELSRDDLQVQKDQDGCPIVLAGQQRLDIPLSLSHHDHYVAWSFCLDHELI